MLGTLTTGAQKSKERQDEIIESSLSIIHQLSMQHDPSVHENDIELLQAASFDLIGQIILGGEDLTEEEATKGLQYLDNSQKIAEAIGVGEMANATASQVAQYRAICIQTFGAQEAFGKPESQEQTLERIRFSYQNDVKKLGEVLYLTMGSNLATELCYSHHIIEAWQLLKRLIAISK
jgi:hypothetical protein